MLYAAEVKTEDDVKEEKPTIMNIQSVLPNIKSNNVGGKTLVVVNKDGNRVLVQLTPKVSTPQSTRQSQEGEESQDGTTTTDLTTTSATNASKSAVH